MLGAWGLIRIFHERGSPFLKALLKLSAITCSLIDTFAAVESNVGVCEFSYINVSIKFVIR